MTHKPSRNTVIILLCAAILAVILSSCSTEPASYLLRIKHEPAQSKLTYNLTNHRAGTMFKNGERTDDFETQSECKISFLTEEILPDSAYILREENLWSWDEPVNDSGKVSRKNRKLVYLLHISNRGKVSDFEVIEGRKDSSSLIYIKSYYEQILTVFPEKPVAVGGSWTQSASVPLPDSTVYESLFEYTLKGTAQKNGHQCVIIESKGKAALPAFNNPETEMISSGVDWIEVNEIMYFDYDEGIVIQSESKSRLTIERAYSYIKKADKDKDGNEIKIPEKDWKQVNETVRQEMEETSTYIFVSKDMP